jgi:hypothetical protein
VLSPEEREERARVFASWFSRYAPADECERGLVTDVAESDWTKRRVVTQFTRLEPRLYAVDPWDWSEEEHKQFDRFLRYKTSAERAFTRALRTLEQQRKIWMQEEREQAQRVEVKRMEEEEEKRPKEVSLDEQIAKLKRPPGIFQMVQVQTEEGRTVTWAHPTKDTLLQQLELKGPETTVFRTFEFPQGVPPEYEWVAIAPEERTTAKGRYSETLSAAEWMRAIAQDEARNDEHVGPSGEWLEKETQ